MGDLITKLVSIVAIAISGIPFGASVSASSQATIEAPRFVETERIIEARPLETVGARSVHGVVTANGARIRTRPVSGVVRGLLYKGQAIQVLCEKVVSDGHYWGLIIRGSLTGYVRRDLYRTGHQGTAPGGPGSGTDVPPPWC